ncbi:hypothetical protein F5Y16DRAFT_412885 [Xylariaceae sp. FL0255]|nr:hypothetical protein F5Y16DRAFT_412885 [Xylariaceae sp. FL0255]
MHYREKSKSGKSYIRMDPDCAICSAPAAHACDCEAKGLETAVRQAEHRIMQSVYSNIRTWVREHAQDYILEYFRLLTDRRKDAHAQQMEQLTQAAYYHYNAPPHPNEIARAQASLKQGIDEDWRSSVQRYPEVLEYFYSLVALTLPPESDPAVKDPPLSALNGSRKAHRRSSTVAPESMHDRDRERGRRTPPPPGRGRRTPAPPAGPFQQILPPPVYAQSERRRPRTTAPYPPPSHYGY